MNQSEAEGKKNNPPISKRKQRGGNWLDWTGTISSSFIVVVLLSLYIIYPGNTLALAALLGAVVGWACGLVATPYDADETRSIGNISKVISGVVSGYIVAKLDRALDSVIPSGNKDVTNSAIPPEVVVTHLVVCFIMLITAFIFVYVTRTYNFDIDEVKDKLRSLRKNPQS